GAAGPRHGPARIGSHGAQRRRQPALGIPVQRQGDRLQLAQMTRSQPRSARARNSRRSWIFVASCNGFITRLTRALAELDVKAAVLLRENDNKYGPKFDAAFVAEGIEVHPITPASTNLNARAERFVQTVKR